MVSSIPITTGAPDGTKAVINKSSSRPAAARDDHAARLRIRWKVQKSGTRSRPRMRSAVVTAGCQDDAGEQHQDVRPGRAREQIGEPCEPGQKAGRERIGRDGEKTGMLHPIGRINALNRGNLTTVRQIESTRSSSLACPPRNGHIDRYDQTRPLPRSLLSSRATT